MFKRWIRDIVGITKLEEDARKAAKDHEEALRALEELKAETKNAEKEAVEATRLAQLSKMSPKEQATERGEPWINVIDVKVNKDNIRNGFFELDWNDLFIKELIEFGYGTESDPEEEIVDRWFKGVVVDILSEESMDVDRGMGYINVTPISNNRSEIS